MRKIAMNRKEFLKTAGKIGFGACLCGAASSLARTTALAGIESQAQPGDKTPERAVKRMEFADSWLKRFFDVMDKTLDEETRKKLMQLNGKTCYTDWIQETKQAIPTIEFDEWAKRVAAAPAREDLKVEGNVIHYQYSGSAETGGAVADGICLCPMAESKPSGLSATYCHCSVGYVKEMFELRFKRNVKVELVDSILKGGNRCKFKLTVV